MEGSSKKLLGVGSLVVLAVFSALIVAGSHCARAQAKPAGTAGDSSISKAVGTIKNVQAESITIATDSGEVTANLSPSTKILRVQLGEKDLKNATPLQAQDLHPGDRVLVRWPAASDPHAITALSVMVMTQSDVSAQRQHENEDWQKRGVDGLVSKVDAAGGTITISSGALATKKDIAVHFTKNTILRRYPPDSVNFVDARPAPVEQIKIGDQLFARGTRNQDGSEIDAEEIVSGTFRNIAGTVAAIDAAGNSMTVNDRIAKGTVMVKVTQDSLVKKLTPEMAQGIAMRLKAASGNGDQGAAGQNAGAPKQTAPGGDGRQGQPPGGGRWQGGPGGSGGQGFQRLLNRLPNVPLTDLQKGETVMIVSSIGDSGTVTGFRVLAGTDPILTAVPNNRAAFSLLSSWSLNPSGGGEGEAP